MMSANIIGAMLVSSLYFNKGGFVKIALILCGLFILGHVIDYPISLLYFKEVDIKLPFYAVFVPSGKKFGKVVLSDSASRNVGIIAMYVLPCLFWITSLIRLREKEF